MARNNAYQIACQQLLYRLANRRPRDVETLCQRPFVQWGARRQDAVLDLCGQCRAYVAGEAGTTAGLAGGGREPAAIGAADATGLV